MASKICFSIERDMENLIYLRFNKPCLVVIPKGSINFDSYYNCIYETALENTGIIFSFNLNYVL